MAIGGWSYNKGNSSNNGGNSNNRRGRSYGMMIVVAFGAALLGFLILHKLRERRLYNLILKQKDTDFFSLHLLFQKEREYHQQVTKKNEEMKAKIYSLRTQKMELERRVLEMQSTIDSLKDELRTIEVAYLEKQNEIKMLRQQQDDHPVGNSSRIVALVESLKQKEAEIAGLRRRIDPSGSSPPANVTTGEDVETRIDQGENENGDRRGLIGRRVDKFENVEDQSVKGREEVKNEDAKDGRSKGEEQRLEKQKGRQEKDEEDQDGRKSEIRVGANGVQSTARGKSGFIYNAKDKRWRLIAESRGLENNGRSNGIVRQTSMRFYEDVRGGLKNRVKNPTSNRQVPLVSDGNNQPKGRKTESYSDSLWSGSSENRLASYSIENGETKEREANGKSRMGGEPSPNGDEQGH